MNYILALIMFAGVLSCAGQTNKKSINQQKNIKMETFDQERFDNNKINGVYEFTGDDSSKIKQWASPPDNYTEQIQKNKSNYILYKEFHFKTKLLKTIGEIFYGFPIGTWKEYDLHGKLIKQINYDRPFVFSVEDLDSQMKKEGIDIMKQQPGVSVSRTTNPVPNYNVSYPVSDTNANDFNVIVIDGITGKIINWAVKTRTK